MSRRFFTVCALVLGITALALPVSAQGPSLGTFRWNLLPYCDAIVMEVRQIGGGAFQLTGAHDRCGEPGFLAIQGNATPQPDGSYRLELAHATNQGWSEPTFVALISPATLGGTWAWDGEFGPFRLGVMGEASSGVRLRNRGNTAFGNGALAAASLGRLNSAFGWRALNALLPIGGSTGNEGNAANTAVGADAGLRLTNGARNILVGASAGAHLVTGTANVYLGFVGSDTVPALATESQTIRIGDTSQTRAFITGVSGVTTALNDAVPVVIDSTGQLGTVVSTARAKDDIASLGAAATWIQRLRPVQFRYLQPFADGSRPLQYGLIAEEVEAVAPDLVAHDAAGRPATVKYHVLPSLLLAEVQRLERERAALADELAALKAFVVEKLGQMPTGRPARQQ